MKTEEMTAKLLEMFVAAHGAEPVWNEPPRKRKVYKFGTTYARMASGPNLETWVSANYFPNDDFWSIRGPKGMVHGRTPEQALAAWNAIEAVPA